MRQKNSDFLAQLKFSTKLTLFVLLGGVTLAFNPRGYNLFVVPKAYLLFNLSVVAIAAAILYIILGGSFRLPSLWITLSSLVFLVVTGMASVNSVVPRLSFFGKMPRYEGFLALALYMALFFLAANFINSRNDHRELYWTITIITAVVSLYAVLQVFEIDFIRWDPGLVSSRVRSFTGNASSLGAFLSLTLPFIASSLFLPSNKKSKIFVWVILFLGIFASALTRSRGAWLALLVAGLFVLFRRFQERRKGQQPTSWKKNILSLVLAAVLLISAAYSFSYIEFERGTASGRLLLWERTTKGIAAKPILGWGPETFQYTFPRYINKRFDEQVTRKTIIDNAHNLFLHTAFSTGLLSSIILALLIFLIFKKALSSKERGADDIYKIGLVAGLIGYLVALQFHFSTIAVSPVFWIMAGSVLSVDQRGEDSAWLLGQSKLRYLLILPLVLLTFTWLLMATPAAKTIMADMRLRDAMSEASVGETTTAYMSLIEAETLHPGEAYYPFMTGQIMIEIGEEQRSTRLLAEAKKAFNRARDINPIDEYTLLGLADVEYDIWKINGSKKNLNKAISRYQKILKNDRFFSEARIKYNKAKREAKN